MRITGLLVRLVAAVLASVPLWVWTPGALTSAAAPMPVDHVIVLMQENRSYDSYFGRLHFQGHGETGQSLRRIASLPPQKHAAPVPGLGIARLMIKHAPESRRKRAP